MKLYYKGEQCKFKWLHLCRRADAERPKYVNLPEGTNDGFYRRTGFLVLYWRLPWKTWKYSINRDDVVHDYPVGSLWIRLYSDAVFGNKALAGNTSEVR